MEDNNIKDLLSEHGINPKDTKKSKKEKRKDVNVEQEKEEVNIVEDKENKESQESNKNTNTDNKNNVDNIINKYMNDTYNSSNFKYTTITYTKPICEDDEEMEDNYNEQELQNRINILKENNKDNDNIIAILESLVHIENKYSKIKEEIDDIISNRNILKQYVENIKKDFNNIQKDYNVLYNDNTRNKYMCNQNKEILDIDLLKIQYGEIINKINEIDSKLDKQTLYHIDIYPICFLIGLAIISIFWYFIIH